MKTPLIPNESAMLDVHTLLETPVMTGRQAVLQALRQHGIVRGPEWPRRVERVLADEREMEQANIEEEIRRAQTEPEPPSMSERVPEEFGRTIPTYGNRKRKRRRSLRLLDVLGLTILIALSWIGGLMQ